MYLVNSAEAYFSDRDLRFKGTSAESLSIASTKAYEIIEG